MRDKIKEMSKFLWACQVTGYLLPEQVALLSMGLEILEMLVQRDDADWEQSLSEILDQKITELKKVSV